jgi:hypothetical protein
LAYQTNINSQVDCLIKQSIVNKFKQFKSNGFELEELLSLTIIIS